jgi:LacI family transcriptional regulator
MDKVTIHDVAMQARVSKATVSRVINNSGYINPDTRMKVVEAIKELNYQPSALARSLRRKETKTIGVVISNILNPFFTAVVRGIEDVAQRAQYSIILCNTDEDPLKEERYLQVLRAKRVDGLIIATAGGNDYHDIILNGEPPIVFIDRRINWVGKEAADTVLVDNQGGSIEAVEHLIKSGYQKIGIITGPKIITTGFERWKGYCIALERNGISYDDRLVRVSDFRGISTAELTKDLLEGIRCDSIFVANNLILLGVLQVVGDLGLAIPRDLGLVAFDDIPWMQFTTPTLTAIVQPTYEIGATAARMLLGRIYGHRKGPAEEIVLPVKLIQRESSLK